MPLCGTVRRRGASDARGAPAAEQAASRFWTGYPRLQAQVIRQQRCFVFAAQQMENPREIAQPAQLRPDALGIRCSDLHHLAQHHRKCGDALTEASPSSLQAVSLAFRQRSFRLIRGFRIRTGPSCCIIYPKMRRELLASPVRLLPGR